jgi:hypothetical protein
MEEQWFVDRVRLRELLLKNPKASRRHLAEETGRSMGWVNKWYKRLLAAGLDDEDVLHGRSRAPHHPPEAIRPEVVTRILEIRDHPPENLRRIPGPRAILYYLHRDEALKASGVHLPSAASTVWAILTRHGRITRPPEIEHQLMERPEPLSAWQMDFKDVSSVPPDGTGKRQHVVETLNMIDMGTSLLLESLPAGDYTAETALLAVAQTLVVHGLPDQITFDRDPRFVGSWSGRDFPSALLRFLLCLGVQPDVCPPQRPDRNGFVERFNRSYDEECLSTTRPDTLDKTIIVTDEYRQHYNLERPNQALSCKNQPPAFAFKELPMRPRPPVVIDTDGWLKAVDRQCFKRRVSSSGKVVVNRSSYYVGVNLAARNVVLRVDAQAKAFHVEAQGRRVKTILIKGLHNMFLDFQGYLELMRREAISEWRLTQRSLRRRNTMLSNRSES